MNTLETSYQDSFAIATLYLLGRGCKKTEIPLKPFPVEIGVLLFEQHSNQQRLSCNFTQYVGETKTTLKQRFYKHYADIHRNTGTHVTNHFCQPGHSDSSLRCIPIEQLLSSPEYTSRPRRREFFWMTKLRADGSIEIWSRPDNWYQEKVIAVAEKRQVDGIVWMNSRLFSVGMDSIVVEYDLVSLAIKVGTEDGCVMLFDAKDDQLEYLRSFDKLEGVDTTLSFSHISGNDQRFLRVPAVPSVMEFDVLNEEYSGWSRGAHFPDQWLRQRGLLKGIACQPSAPNKVFLHSEHNLLVINRSQPMPESNYPLFKGKKPSDTPRCLIASNQYRVSKWFDMLFPDVSYPSTRLSGALDRLEKKVQAVQREDGDIDSFLKTEVDFDFVSSSLSKADANVAASQCGKVISIVGQHLFNVDLKEEDLPKLQNSINIADEGHFLAKFQATETILAADNVTLHTDGTSRGAHKIVGQQITLDSGATLYLGLNTVATEDSETLLEVTIQMLQELSDVYAAEETNDRKEEVFNALLTKLTSCMSDRAAVMKLFSTKLSDFLQSTLGQEVTLHFLKCNAHFLLGLSRSCETSLKTLEEEMTEQLGWKLGRDTHQKFQRFRGNERATARVIRLASSLLGPRGDEKNGCRAEWLAFLKNKSLLTSYRSNRFNCFFLSAAAVVHHQHDMKNFLHGGSLGHSNLKIESLAEDLKDDHLLALVCAVALLYFAITGPFWQLLESNTKYLELHTYIQQLERSVERWRGDASELLDPGFPGVFGGEFCIVSDMKAAVYKFVSEHTNTVSVKHALEVLMRDLLVVMRLQLVDFLSGGKYGQAQPPEVMEKLKHCPITNLLDEVRYQKQVLGVGKTLKITKTNGELQQALKAHLGPEQQTDHDSSSEDDLEPPLPKRQRTMEPTPEFTRQGEWVAVFYDQGFLIGQVTLVENPGTAHVSFLENTKSRRDYFRWPRVEDVANVDSQYVFRWDVEVLPVSNDGRIWQVSDLQDIADAYKRLLQ
ncbi:hypothetical protein ACOMHN_007010 [Nucella lapillus]